MDLILLILKFYKELFSSGGSSSNFNSKNFNIVGVLFFIIVSGSFAINYFAISKLINISIRYVEMEREVVKLKPLVKELDDVKYNLEGCKELVKFLIPAEKPKKGKNVDKH